MKRLKQPKGFTLIELLTVIAIIALLAAILFPVFGRVRAQAREGSCISQLHQTYVALKLYREDFGKFPAVLFGYVQTSDVLDRDGKPTFYTGTGNPISPEKISYRPLTVGQKYLKDRNVFACPDSDEGRLFALQGQLLPPQDTPIDGKAYIKAVYPGDEEHRDAKTPLTGQPVVYTELIKETCCNNSIPIGEAAYFYPFDSYDVGPQIDDSGNRTGVMEAHYSLDWTGGSGPDDPSNQMKYPDPPQDSTVITWCTYHAAFANSNKIMVLLLNGKAAAVPIKNFLDKGPLKYNIAQKMVIP